MRNIRTISLVVCAFVFVAIGFIIPMMAGVEGKPEAEETRLEVIGEADLDGQDTSVRSLDRRMFSGSGLHETEVFYLPKGITRFTFKYKRLMGDDSPSCLAVSLYKSHREDMLDMSIAKYFTGSEMSSSMSFQRTITLRSGFYMLEVHNVGNWSIQIEQED